VNRRRFLGAAVAASALTGCRFSLEQGLFNECRAPGGHRVFREPLVRAAWSGVDPARVWDCHAHLFGNGRTGSGIFLSPGFDRPTTLAGQVRRAMFFNAACGGEDEERLDQAVVERIGHLAEELPAGAKVMLLAFDFTYDPDGRRREDLTTFAVADAYAARVARARPDRFEWIASVHPLEDDYPQRVTPGIPHSAKQEYIERWMEVKQAAAEARPRYRVARKMKATATTTISAA